MKLIKIIKDNKEYKLVFDVENKVPLMLERQIQENDESKIDAVMIDKTEFVFSLQRNRTYTTYKIMFSIDGSLVYYKKIKIPPLTNLVNETTIQNEKVNTIQTVTLKSDFDTNTFAETQDIVNKNIIVGDLMSDITGVRKISKSIREVN